MITYEICGKTHLLNANMIQYLKAFPEGDHSRVSELVGVTDYVFRFPAERSDGMRDELLCFETATVLRSAKGILYNLIF